jgi:TolB-like protein/Tfp pilus assembly protein PilF
MPESGATPGHEGSPLPGKKLDSWKEIADYLGREVRTVQRWEKTEGLPVHRHEHKKKSTVYAYTRELDEWFKKRQPKDDPEADAAFVPEPDVDNPSDIVANEPITPATVSTAVSEPLRTGPGGAGENAPPKGKRPVLLLAAAAILCLAVYGVYHWIQVQAMTQTKVRLVVLPFKNLSGDASQNYISEGLTEDITTQLGRLDPVHLGVIAPTSAKIMAGRSVKDIGKSLTVQYVLEGSVQRVANRARIDVQLIQVSDETPMWADSFTRELSDFLQVESDVADTIALRMKASLPVPPASARTRGQPALPAPVSAEMLAKSRDAYLRGRFTWGSRGDLRSSIDFFEQAIQQDPSYAQAYAGLAAATAIIGQVPNDGMPPRDAKPKAKEAAQHALRLDPRLAEAHAVLGNVAMSYDWDLQNAENELKLAIDLNPSNASAHEFYAHLLMVERRNAEALTEIHHALDLDPVSPLFHTVLAQALYYGRRYDEAISQAQNVVNVNPNFVLAQFWLGCAYREKKMYPQAVQTFTRARQLSGDMPAMLMAYGHAQALAGNAKEARDALHKLEQLRGTRFIPNLYLAAIHVGLGEKDEAFRLLDLAYQEKVDYLVYLGVEPMADPLRSDPRFAQLLAKIGVH